MNYIDFEQQLFGQVLSRLQDRQHPRVIRVALAHPRRGHRHALLVEWEPTQLRDSS